MKQATFNPFIQFIFIWIATNKLLYKYSGPMQCHREREIMVKEYRETEWEKDATS